MSARPFIVEWYRPDVGKQAFLMWGVAAGILMVGALCIGLIKAELLPISEDVTLLMTILGVLATVTGPLVGAIYFTRLISTPTPELIFRSDGILYVDPPADPVFIAWSDLEKVTSREGFLELETDSGHRLGFDYQFLSISTHALIERIEELQRRALMGVLRPDEGFKRLPGTAR